MAEFRVGLLAVWALGCSVPESTVLENAAESAEPAPSDDANTDQVPDSTPAVPSETDRDVPRDTATNVPRDTSSSVPRNDLPAPQGSGGAGGMNAGAGGSPALEPPRSEVIEVSDGSFTPGQPPAPAESETTLSQIVNVVGPPAVTNGGSATLHVELSPPVASPTFVIGLNGENGYHTVTGSDPNSDGIYDITAVVAAGATQTSLAFRVALQDAAGNVGPYREIEIPVIQSGTGDVKITLSWDRLHDLDLRVIEPGGEEIRFANAASRTGGELDLDSGANCGQTATNSENIFWPSGGGPAGEYVVAVHNYQQCSAGAIDYTVRIVYDNSVSTYRGSFADGTASETDTADNPREVARFRR